MTIQINPAQRNALYEYVLDRLTGIDDVWGAIGSENWERATQLGWEYSDYLRLILDDLEWGDSGPERCIELSAPVDVLRRVFSRLQELAEARQASEEDDWADLRERRVCNRLVVEACKTVLGEL